MNPNDVAPMVAGIVFFVMAGLVLIFRGPLGKAMARRIEGQVASPELETRLGELEARLSRVEEERHELAERLDFTERVLLQVREGSKELPGGSGR